MKKLIRKIISFILMVLMVSNISISAFASETELSSKNTNINKCNIVITDDGVYINDVYYTQEQFVKLLNTAVEIDITELKNDTIRNNSVMRSVGVQDLTGTLIAGTWWIPGIGKIVITATGILIIGGTVIAAGTWLYNKVVDWFEARAKAEKYEQAKEKGVKTDNHEQVEGENSLPTKGDPYSSKDLLDSDGELKQRRYYDKNGDADMDIDYKHGGVGHEFPHRHYWNNGLRGSAVQF